MPPIASKVVDDVGLAVVRKWVTQLYDARDADVSDASVTPDSAVDDGSDAGSH